MLIRTIEDGSTVLRPEPCVEMWSGDGETHEPITDSTEIQITCDYIMTDHTWHVHNATGFTLASLRAAVLCEILRDARLLGYEPGPMWLESIREAEPNKYVVSIGT